MEELNFRLEAFEGPLELLLKLITKNKVDICDIPISLIFDQYMEHISAMPEIGMDSAGEFIDMASYLMLIKSRMLLPKPPGEEGEDPRAALAAALEEYKKIKEIAVSLSERYALYGGRREKEPQIMRTAVVGPFEPSALEAALRSAVRRFRASLAEAAQRAADDRLEPIIKTRPVPVIGRIFGIMRYLYKNGDAGFMTLLLISRSRDGVIAGFIALLELLRSQRVKIAGTGEGDELIFHLNRERAG